MGSEMCIRDSNETPFVDDELWDKWWVIVLITAILAAEWILRKVVRLV